MTITTFATGISFFLNYRLLDGDAASLCQYESYDFVHLRRYEYEGITDGMFTNYHMIVIAYITPCGVFLA